MKQLLIAATLICTLVLTGCPSARTIEKAKAASGKLATYANTGVNVTRDLYREAIINLSQKDKIAKAFIILADAGIAFDKAVANAEAQYGSSVPGSELDKLFGTFDSEVVGRFLGVLEALKVVQGTQAYLAIIETLKTAVLIIAKAFGKQQYVEGRIG